MASSNPNPNPNQHHPLQPPTTTGGTSSSSASGGGVGIGRSAPIRTLLPTPGPPPISGLHPSSLLPGGVMSTPPLVKSKLALTTGRGGGQSSSAAGAAAVATGQVAHATRNPVGPLPPRVASQQNKPPLPHHSSQPPTRNISATTNATVAPHYQSYDPFAQPAPSTPGVTHPIAMPRLTPGTNYDPVELARQSPGASGVANTPENSAQLQPHIVSLPPPTQTTFHPLDDAAAAAGGGGSSSTSPQTQQKMYQTQQQQQSIYQPYSQQSIPASTQQQQHPLKHPPSSTSYKQPPPPTTQQPVAQTQKQSSPTKQPPRSPQKQPSAPDEEVDAFLRGGSTSNSGGNTLRKLRPSPLASGSILDKTKTLASRRAWGDVIRVTNDALLVGNKDDGGVHYGCYGELLAAASGDVGGAGPSVPPNDHATISSEGSDLNKSRQETSELMALRFISQLKLRRYVDLGNEVMQLGLMPYLPDHPLPSTAGTGGAGGGHLRAISGMSGIGMHDAVPPSPGTPGTMGTEVSIEMLSSSPVGSTPKQGQSSQPPGHPLSWKEGSIHPSNQTKDALPSWVPFGLRILAAHQLQYNDGSSRAIDVLYDLRDRTVRTAYWGTQGMEIWRPAIDNALVNTFVRKREWRLALRSLEDLMGGLEDGVGREVDWWCGGDGGDVSEEERKQMNELITDAAHVELLSRQLLILLQSGAVHAAEIVQEDVRRHAARVQSSQQRNHPASSTTTLVGATREVMALVRQAPHRQMVNEGLLLFARCKHTDAAKYFRDALNQQRLDANPPMGCHLPTWNDLTSPTLGFSAEPSLIVECLNNMSLCLLYSGHMQSSVQELENLIREDPCLYLTEGVAFNLCTLYELGSEGEECMRKKKVLQRVAKRFYLHDVGVESFRLG